MGQVSERYIVYTAAADCERRLDSGPRYSSKDDTILSCAEES